MAITLGGGGGVSVPIGGDLNLLDTAATVTKGSEVFLRTGQTAPSSTYPNAPVKSFINNGTLAQQVDYDKNIAPWQSSTTANQNLSGAMSDTGTGELFIVSNFGYVNKFTNYGAAYAGSRNLCDGTVFPTTATASYISPVNFARSGRAQGTAMPNTTMRAFFSPTGGSGGAPGIAYLDNDLQTHRGTFTLGNSTVSWPGNTNNIFAAFLASNLVAIVHGASYSLYISVFSTPNFSSGSSGTLSFQYMRTYTLDTYFQFIPEIVPYPSNDNPWIGVRTQWQYVSYRNIFYFNPQSGSTSYATYLAYDRTNITSNTSSYRAPYVHGTHGLMYTRYNQASPYARLYSNANNNNTDIVGPFNTTGYRGYTFKDANTVYVGHAAQNKIFAIHPTTNAVGTSISTSSQAAPYRLAHHNNVLYNLNGTNIHTYSTTSNAFVSTIDISNKVSGTNAVGIAHDGTNLYVLDGSNSKIHKYNATGSSYVSFVTLSDTPHSSATLVSLAVDLANSVFYVTDSTNCSLYGLDGTAKVASVTTGWEDSEVHNGHLVGMRNDTLTTTKVPTVDVVGNPTGSLGAVSTTYYRVS